MLLNQLFLLARYLKARNVGKMVSNFGTLPTFCGETTQYLFIGLIITPSQFQAMCAVHF